MNHDNKVVFSVVDNHTWMEMSLEALSDDILLYIKGAEKICLFVVSASNERQLSRDWWSQTVHVYSQFVVA